MAGVTFTAGVTAAAAFTVSCTLAVAWVYLLVLDGVKITFSACVPAASTVPAAGT